MSRHILIATIMRPVGDTGVQTHFLAIANYLKKIGKPVQLITPFDRLKYFVYPVFGLRRLIDLINGMATVWWYRHWHFVFLRLSLKKKLADGLACVIYAQCPLSAYAAIQVRKSELQRVVMVVHFNISQADEWVGKGKISGRSILFHSIRKFESKAIPLLDGLVFVSEFMRSELTQRLPNIKKTPYRVIPNFFADPGLNFTNDFELTDLICIGTLEPRKNQRYAIEIVAAAKKFGRSISMTLVGDGPCRSELEALCHKLGISDQVKFTGFIRNASSLLSQHRACLHVAKIENLPLTLIEALAYGKPIFASAVGGVPEVFNDGDEGRVIPLNNADTAARLIFEWMDSEEHMRQASMLARNRYLHSFEETMVAQRLVDFLDQQI